MTELVDTHCHIQSAGLKEGERVTRELWAKAPELTGDKMVIDAVKDSVTQLICVGCDLDDSRLAIDFAQKHKGCWASVGIHPHEAKHYAPAAPLKEFAELAKQPEVVAVGECGLDYYYEHSPKEAQTRILRFQIELALKHNLPIIFHVREAFDDFWSIFDDYEGLNGVVHSFTDSSDNLQKILDRRLYVGVNGIATFAKKPEQMQVYKAIPLDRLLLETDAPFLAPVPHRGQVNQPKHTKQVAEFLAGLRGEKVEDLARATTANARQLFGI